MGAIVRIKSGNFDIEDAVELDSVSEDDIIPLKNILKDWQNIFINNDFYDKIINGCAIQVDIQDAKNCVVYCKEQLIGIADIESGHLKIKTYLLENND